MRFYSSILAAICILSLAVSGAHVQELTDANFERLVASGTRFPKDNWLLVFYSPKSAKSMQVMSGLQTAAQTLGKEANVAKVDCSGAGRTLCKRFSVKSYPTISFIKSKNVYDHVGKRTAEDFVSFVRSSHTKQDAYEFPMPYSLMEDIQKELFLLANRLPEETEKMLLHAPFLGTMLFFTGTMSGFIIAIMISLCCFGDGGRDGRLTAEQYQLLEQERERAIAETTQKSGAKGGKTSQKAGKKGAAKALQTKSSSEGDDFELVDGDVDEDEGLGGEVKEGDSVGDSSEEVSEAKKDVKKTKKEAGGAKKGKKKNA